MRGSCVYYVLAPTEANEGALDVQTHGLTVGRAGLSSLFVLTHLRGVVVRWPCVT